MSMKVLIETLIQIPDKQLLTQLQAQIKKNRSLMICDIDKYFVMLRCLFSGVDKAIKLKAITIYRESFQFLLKIEVERSWRETAIGVVRMCGEEDAEVRKHAKELMFEIIDLTNNANIVLEKLYYDGLQNQSILVMISSMKIIYQILQLYPTILHNKISIRIIKLILQKLIAISMSSTHIQLTKNAKQFLLRLFYLKIQKLDTVLTLMNEKVLQYLENIWQKNKLKLMQRQKQQQQQWNRAAIEIKYEHLMLVNGKFFGVYEPYILKNIFNPDIKQAKYLAISHFRLVFENHFQQLRKYINVIFKIILKYIPQYHYDLLMMLKHIVQSKGINNIINLSIIPNILVNQLSTSNVPYRRQLRNIFCKLHYQYPKQCLNAYQQEISNNQTICWIGMFQIISLLQHWIDNNMEISYPPMLDKMLKIICNNLNSWHTKLKDRSLDILLIILDRYPGYRQNLQDYFRQQKIQQIQDMIQLRKNKGRGNAISQQAQQIFMKQYYEERERFILFQDMKKN